MNRIHRLPIRKKIMVIALSLVLAMLFGFALSLL